MKVIDKIIEILAICAFWVLAILLIFGNCFIETVYYQVLSVSLAVIAVFFAIKALEKKVCE